MWIDGSCLIWVQSAAGSVTGRPSTLPNTKSPSPVCPGGELVPKRDVDRSPVPSHPALGKAHRPRRAPGPGTQAPRPCGRAGRGETVRSQIPGARRAGVSGGSSHFLRKWPRALVKAAFSRSPPGRRDRTCKLTVLGGNRGFERKGARCGRPFCPSPLIFSRFAFRSCFLTALPSAFLSVGVLPRLNRTRRGRPWLHQRVFRAEALSDENAKAF